MEKVSKSLIEDIFGIPQDGSHIKNDEEDDSLGVSSSESTSSFEIKVSELKEKLVNIDDAPLPSGGGKSSKEKVVDKNNKLFGSLFDDEDEAPKTPKTKEKIVPEVIKTTETVVTKPVETKVVEKVATAEDISDMQKQLANVVIPVQKQEEKKEERKRLPSNSLKGVKPIVKDEIDTVADDDDEDGKDGPCEQWTKEEEWLLNSPAPKYNKFYQEKLMALQGSRSILPGGLVPFTKYFNELSELNCDITVQTADLEGIHNKMQLVQQMRERLRHIQQHVDQQYYLWERYIELFHGILCRVEYERGKQDGIYYEHMRDMEHYYCSLKSLHRVAEQVMRTLDGAFECLSRQVTIAMPMREAERHFSTNVSGGQKPITQEMKRYDSLPTANSKTTEKDGDIPKGWNV